MKNNSAVQEAFETIKKFCKNKIDGCSNCLFCVRLNSDTLGCIILSDYPCNWGSLDVD